MSDDDTNIWATDAPSSPNDVQDRTQDVEQDGVQGVEQNGVQNGGPDGVQDGATTDYECVGVTTLPVQNRAGHVTEHLVLAVERHRRTGAYRVLDLSGCAVDEYGSSG